MIAMIGEAAKGAPQPRAPDAAGLEQCLTLVIGQFDQSITNVLGDRCMLFGRSGIRSSLSRFGMRAAFNVTIGVMKSALTGQKVLSAWVTHPAAPRRTGTG